MDTSLTQLQLSFLCAARACSAYATGTAHTYQLRSMDAPRLKTIKGKIPGFILTNIHHSETTSRY